MTNDSVLTASMPAPREPYSQPALSHVATGTSALKDNRLWHVVSGIADINQCIYLILLTPLGSDPLRPHFGSRVHDYTDMPITEARTYLIREVHHALWLWEPRIVVDEVRVYLADGEMAHLMGQVVWHFADSVDNLSYITALMMQAAF